MTTMGIDYIAANHQITLDFNGKYVFLIGDNQLDLFETEQVRQEITHPITGRNFEFEELEYIAFHNRYYQEMRTLEITQEILNDFIDWYLDVRKGNLTVEFLRDDPRTQQAYDIIRFYMIPTDFQSHFRDFDPQDSDQEKYERDLAEKALRENGKKGAWLIRHSSYNRPLGEENQAYLKKMGIRYYALSYINPKDGWIMHSLIRYSIGKGYQIDDQNFTNFLDTLESGLKNRDLVFASRIDNYVTDNIPFPPKLEIPILSI